MASPSEAEIQAQISNLTAYYLAARAFGSSASPNLIGLEDTVVQSLEGDYSHEVLAALRAIRQGYGGLLASFRAAFDPLWLAYGKVRSIPETSVQAILSRLYDDFIDNSKSVNGREFTFGSVSAGGSNVGNGTVLTLNVDRSNLEIESPHAETKIFECIHDGRSGANEHEEVFDVRGGHADRDGILRNGTGLSGRIIQAASAKTSGQNGIQNPSFSGFTGSISALTALLGWTVGTIGNFTLDEANVYRGYPGDTTPRALVFSGNDSIQQNLTTRRFRNPAPGGVLAPMCLRVAYNREVGSADGTLTLTLGSQTEAVALSAQAGWNILQIGPSQENWFDVWNQEDALVKIALSSNTTGTLLVDDVVFAPFVPIDGLWYLPVGGSTPFKKNDTFSFANSISSDAKIQRMIAEIYGMYLPHNAAGSETWSDPT